jgi:hypothetical protein
MTPLRAEAPGTRFSSRNSVKPGRLRTQSSTNRRIAEDRLGRWRDFSISVTVCDIVAPWACAISFRQLQNASSRQTLVLCPSTITERLTTLDFKMAPFEQSTSHRIVP